MGIFEGKTVENLNQVPKSTREHNILVGIRLTRKHGRIKRSITRYLPAMMGARSEKDLLAYCFGVSYHFSISGKRYPFDRKYTYRLYRNEQTSKNSPVACLLASSTVVRAVHRDACGPCCTGDISTTLLSKQLAAVCLNTAPRRRQGWSWRRCFEYPQRHGCCSAGYSSKVHLGIEHAVMRIDQCCTGREK